MFETLQKTYRDLCRKNGWAVDADQLAALRHLAELADAIQTSKKSHGFWGLFRRSSGPEIRGVYMYGDVGRGKSFVMDLFFESIDITAKQRSHFNDFMLDIHARLHKLRNTKGARVDDALLTVADDIAVHTSLLCFDEMFVEDVGDAMLLGRLFSALFDRGVFVVMTSNCRPDDLYPGGLQRERFIPFINLIKQKMHVIEFKGRVDYRADIAGVDDKYITPDDKTAQEQMRRSFAAHTGHVPLRPVTLSVGGRALTFDHAAGHAVMVDFQTLCGQALGAADYLALAERFSDVYLMHVPQLNDDLRNETRRFMTLIDTLYEKKTRLHCTAQTPIEEIYKGNHYYPAFYRTESRLTEMRGAEYP